MKSLFLLTFLVCLLTLSACQKTAPLVTDIRQNPYFLANDHVINIDEVAVRYRDEGPKNASNIVMIHGFTSSLETWDAIAQDLKSDFRVIRLDLSGHGLTGPDPLGRYSNAQSVDLVEKFLAAHSLTNTILVGNSLGGLIAWRTAARGTRPISQLVLISPGGFSINGVSDRPIKIPKMVQYYLKKAPTTAVKQASSALYADPSKLSKTRQKTIRDMMLHSGNGEAFVARLARFTLPDPTHELSQIKTPTLLLWGKADIMVPVAHGQKFKSAMPNATLEIFDNAGHVPHEEIPAQTIQKIRSFLAQNSLEATQ